MSARDSLDDRPLLPTSSTGKAEYFEKKSANSWQKNALLIVSVSLNLVLAAGYFVIKPHTNPAHSPKGYAPTEDLIEYVPKQFTNIFERSKYNGPPSPAIDQAWEELYIDGIMGIPKSMAAHLPNRTMPIPGNEENYIVTFDVFHQLHCLNMIRQMTQPEYYNDAYYARKGSHNPLMVEGHEGFDHMAHCVDSIRESLTCSADITPIVWTWDIKEQRSSPKLEVVHTCRNYERIEQFAKDHRLRGQFDSKVHVLSIQHGIHAHISSTYIIGLGRIPGSGLQQMLLCARQSPTEVGHVRSRI